MQKSYSCRTRTKMQLPVIRPREFTLNLIVLLSESVFVCVGWEGYEVPAGFLLVFFVVSSFFWFSARNICKKYVG